MKLKKLIKKIVGSKTGLKVTGWVLDHATFFLPIKPLRDSSAWLAFLHPEPCYPIHIRILPKRSIANWMMLPVDGPVLYSEYIDLIQSMIRDFCLEEAGYRIITNGGVYQTFPQFHVHPVPGESSKAGLNII